MITAARIGRWLPNVHPLRDYLKGSRQDQIMYEAMARAAERDDRETAAAARRRAEATDG